MIAFFVGNYELFVGRNIMIVALGTYGVFFLVLAFEYNQHSQDMFESVQDLKILVEEIDIKDENKMIFIGEKKLRATHAQKMILTEIDKFKGFDGNGFFTLGKPLLTSILANFVTYLIILIQFKMSENSA